MICPKCQTTNPDGAKLCSFCGEPISVAPSSAVPPPQQRPMQGPRQQPDQPRKAEGNGMAVAGMVMGIAAIATCGLLLILALPGLILSILGLNKANKSGGRIGGKGMATAGIVMCSLAFFMLPVLAAILFPVIAKAREKARQSICINNQRQIAIAMQISAQDNAGLLPKKENWTESIAPQMASNKQFDCPTATGPGAMQGGAAEYGYNATLPGRKINELSNPASILLTADATTPLITTDNDIDYRHGTGVIASFLDGHAAYVAEGDSLLK